MKLMPLLLKRLRVSELRQELADGGLDTDGSRTQLEERLREAEAKRLARAALPPPGALEAAAGLESVPPSPAMRAAAASAFSFVRQPSQTSQPFEARAAAHASPMPDDAPVTRARPG